jgi:hypothetical protein
MRSNGGGVDVESERQFLYISSIKDRVDQAPAREGECLSWKRKFLCPIGVSGCCTASTLQE